MVNKCERCGYAKLPSILSKEIDKSGKCLMFEGLRIQAEDPACKLFCSNPPYCTRCGAILRNDQVLIVNNKIYCKNCGVNI